MRIRKPPGVTRTQVVIVSLIGIFGGVYIWRPVFEQLKQERKAKRLDNQEK